MPVPELFPTTALLRRISLDVDDLTLDMFDGVEVTLTLTYSDGDRFTVLHRTLTHKAVGELPEQARDLLTAFLWGEGARDVLRWASALDPGAQSRRVRRTL